MIFRSTKSGLLAMSLWTMFYMHPVESEASGKFTVSGTVKDKSTGELLIGATIKIQEQGTGVTTNSYGFYSITLADGLYHLLVSYTGYQVIDQEINLQNNQILNFDLAGLPPLAGVTIYSKKRNENITMPVMGVEKLNTSSLNRLPVLLGEKDLMKSIQLLPGIKNSGEGNSGFYVRGGGSDQNLILLDEAPVYNAAHLLGFFSTFNSDAIKDVTLYKGGMPAQYGGRLSSVVDIKMKDGNSRKYETSGGVGLISSRLNIEGPTVKDKGSFMVSARRSYADLFLKLSRDSALRNNRLYFYDLNVKANYLLGKKDRAYLSGYFGRDILGVGETYETDWGNKTGTIRWNHLFSSKIFGNTSLIYSDYSYNLKIKSGTDKFKITSRISDFNLKQDLDFFVNAGNKIKLGGNIIGHTVSPGRIRAEGASNIKSQQIQDRYSRESAIYATDELTINGKLKVMYGLRLSNLAVVGPGDFFNYDDEGNILDTIKYNKGQKVVSYWNTEPRLSISYQLSENKSIKASYNRNTQNLHLLTNATSSTPTDLWLPSTNNIKPEMSDQYSVGYYQNFWDNQYEWSTEAYYKSMRNQVDYRNGADLQGNANVESELLYGRGRAYGIELMLKKKQGRLNGWIGYTLSKSERQFSEINNGRWYNAKQDRTHDLSAVAVYRMNEVWTLSGTFVFYTGNAVTFPDGKYRVNNQTVFLYTERNGSWMPTYHRLDVSATLGSKRNKYRRYQSYWTFGIYNVYGRQNAFSIEFKDDPKDSTKTIAERTALFTVIPGITWNFKF